MGKHPVEITVSCIEERPDSSVEKRPAHPFRRIARSILRVSRKPQQHPDASGHTCRGPSFFHNLLPIIDPLCTLNPKLLFIQDRILGRKRAPCNGGSFKVPSSSNELKSWVEEAWVPCDCDECAPKDYRLRDDSSHGTIQYGVCPSNSRSNLFSRESEKPATLVPQLRLRWYGEYEAMRLVRHHVAWLDQTYLRRPLGKDTPAVLQLKSFLHIWRLNLSGADMRQTMSRAQLQHLFTHLNHVFFFNAIPPHRRAFTSSFSWLPEHRKNCFGVSYYNPIVGTHVLLHPTLYRHHSNPQDLNVRWRNRIGTVLHEMCHAFLKAYTCRSCPTHDRCIGARGHGRAWQILAAKIEEVATVVFDGYVDMGRFPSLLHDMEGHGRLPSSHDLEVYMLGDRVFGQANC